MENTMAQIISVVMLRKQLSNLIDLGPNFDNVFQAFQNPHVIGFTRGLMTHQAPQNVQSSQSSHTVTSQGVISPLDGNPPNPDRNDSADDSSAEIEYLENLTQEYETTEGTPICSEKLQKVTEDKIWVTYRTQKCYQVMEKIFCPENIEGLEVNKVYIEVWRKTTVKSIVTSDFKIFVFCYSFCAKVLTYKIHQSF